MKFIHRYLLLIITAVLLIISSNIRWGGDNWKNTIISDGQGYYAYLPGIFIYDDIQMLYFDSIGEKYYNGKYTHFHAGLGDKITNKYYAGTALALTPFFLAAHGIAHVTDHDPNGFSKPYNIAVIIAAVLYLVLGLWFIRKLLRSYEATDNQILIILLAIAFGTNAFYYALCEPTMSHVYSFAFVSMFMWQARSWLLNGKNYHLLMLSFALGMIILIRPVNGLIVLLLPFLAGSREVLKHSTISLLRNITVLAGAILITSSIVFIQLIIYKLQTGQFIVYSYGAETFVWSDSHVIDFLFSYKKGLFLYLPVCLLAVPGLIGIYRMSRFAGISLSLFIILLIYVLSSWWNWWYGGSFGTRVMIEFFPVIAILLLFAMKTIQKKVVRTAYTSLIILAIVFCQLQTYQYRYNIIHWEDMTKEKYWEVFLKMKK